MNFVVDTFISLISKELTENNDLFDTLLLKVFKILR